MEIKISSELSSVLVGALVPVVAAISKKISDKLNEKALLMNDLFLNAQKAIPGDELNDGERRFQYALRAAEAIWPNEKINSLEPKMRAAYAKYRARNPK